MMAERTLVENVAQVKDAFKSVKDAGSYFIDDGTPPIQYGEKIFTEISSLKYQADSAHTQGVEQGKQEVISNSKYIEKTASGKVIRLDDVSEVAHKVKVKADTPTEVKVCGKNLFNNDTSLLKEVTYTGSSGTQSTRVGYEPYVLHAGIYTFTITDLNPSYSKFIYGMICTEDNKYVRSYSLLQNTANNTPLTITVNEGEKVLIYNGHSNLNMNDRAAEFAQVQIQLEVGFAATSYEEYKEPQTITATPEGTEAASICPTMTFLADTDVTVDYFGSYGRAEAELMMWNGITCNGTRQYYSYGFAYVDFSDYTIPEGLCKPRSTISYMFSHYKGVEMPKGIDCSRLVTTVASNQCYYTFYYATNLKKIYDMGIPAGMAYGTTFSYCSALEEIEKIRCDENTTFNTNAFNQCTNLIHIGFTGTIASDINLQWSTKLSRESILSLLQCLNATVSEKTITLPSKCIDKVTDTLALIQGDTELNTAYTQALANGYTITFA